MIMIMIMIMILLLKCWAILLKIARKKYLDYQYYEIIKGIWITMSFNHFYSKYQEVKILLRPESRGSVKPHLTRGGAQSARANFKDSYLRNEYCYCNEIWWLFIKFIGVDNSVLIIPVPIKPLPWQPLCQSALLKILTWNFLKCIFISSFSIEMLNLDKIETVSMFLINFWLILSSFRIFQKIQDGGHEINMAFYDVIVTS